MKKALFPGSFDPFHIGHLNILKKANELFDEVIIFIGNNKNKKSTSFVDRYNQVINFLNLNNLSNKVVYGNDLTVDIAKNYHCKYLIRGIRNMQDFEYEQEIFNINKKLSNEIETIYFIAENEYINISSKKL